MDEKKMSDKELAEALSAAADCEGAAPSGAQSAPVLPRDGTFLKLLAEVLKRLLLSKL